MNTRSKGSFHSCNWHGVALVAAGVAFAIIVAASVGCRGEKTTSRPQASLKAEPKAVVDHAPWDLGVIESGEEFKHTFVIRNEGGAPLTLKEGPKLCACTVTKLADKPVPPGGQTDVAVSFAPWAAAEVMKEGHFSRGIRVLTNDPDNPDMLLEVHFTVNRRLMAAPADFTPTLDSSKALTKEQRTLETFVSSERWKKFSLKFANASRKDLQCRIEAVDKEKAGEDAKRGGYRVSITLPAELPEGRLNEWVDVVGTPEATAGVDKKTSDAKKTNKSKNDSEPETLRLAIHGSVRGRVELISTKIDGGVVLRWGALVQGQAAHETVLVKINDPERNLVVKKIETTPKFLRAKFSPYHKGENRAGLYRLELEIPADAPTCAFTSSYGRVELHTNHPRLAIILLKVDFSIEAVESADR